MKIKSLTLLAGFVGSLMITASAPATFLGVVTRNKDKGFIDPFDPTREMIVVNFFARFDNPEDQLITVFGEGQDKLQITTNAPDGFWNPFNGSLPPTQELVDMFPSAGFDSYLTIGTKRGFLPKGPINGNDTNSPYDMSSQATLTPGFDPFPSFGTNGDISTFGGGVAAPPTIADAPGPPDNPNLPQIKTPQTLAGEDGLVLFMQLSIVTTKNGVPQDDPDAIFSEIFGLLNLGVREKIGGQNIFREIRGLKFNYTVPSPGALALLGIAGLAGCRRRRS